MVIKRVHALECMRLQGWDLAFWKNEKSPLSMHFTGDDLQDLSGNMWNAFSYLRVKIAAVGCVDWGRAEEMKAAEKAKEAVTIDVEESQDSDFDFQDDFDS